MNTKIKKYILPAFFVLFSVLPFFGQKNSEKGDRYFDQNQFDMAIKFYQLDIHSGDRKTAELALKKLANCYRIAGEFEMAETTFKKILKKKKKEPINHLNYALALKNSAKYAEAKTEFEEYIKLKPEDPMGSILALSCDSAQKWLEETIGKEAKNLENINTGLSEFSPVITKDKELSFSSSREGSTKALISFDGGGDVHRLDLYNIRMNEIETKDPKGNEIKNFKGINTAVHEGSATFSADGKEIYFTKTVKGKRDKETNEIQGTLQIFYSRQDSTGKWNAPVSAFNFNSNNYSVGHPSLSHDGKTIYFMSDKPGGLGNTDIYFALKSDDGKWGAAINAGSNVNTFGHELFPYISEAGVLYFSSDAHPGMGQLDIFRAQNDYGKWTNVQNLKPPVNSIANDFGISYDGRFQRGFFSSDRFNGKGAEDIYSFSEDVPLALNIKNDTLHFEDAAVFDDVKYKLLNIADSSEISLVAQNGVYNIVIGPKGSVLLVKKNGMPYNKIDLSYQKDSLNKITRINLRSAEKLVSVEGYLSSVSGNDDLEKENFSNEDEIRIIVAGYDGYGVQRFQNIVEPGVSYFIKSPSALK